MDRDAAPNRDDRHTRVTRRDRLRRGASDQRAGNDVRRKVHVVMNARDRNARRERVRDDRHYRLVAIVAGNRRGERECVRGVTRRERLIVRMIRPLPSRDFLSCFRHERRENRRLERIDAGVQHPLIARQPSRADHHERDLFAATAAEGRDVVKELIVPDSLRVAKKTMIDGMDRQNQRDPFTESRPFVRAPMQRRGQERAGIVDYFARLRENRKRENENQSKPVSTKSAICSA